MKQKIPERFFGNKQELDMLIMQLDMETIATGTPGFFQINYAFTAQVNFLYILR